MKLFFDRPIHPWGRQAQMMWLLAICSLAIGQLLHRTELKEAMLGITAITLFSSVVMSLLQLLLLAESVRLLQRILRSHSYRRIVCYWVPTIVTGIYVVNSIRRAQLGWEEDLASTLFFGLIGWGIVMISMWWSNRRVETEWYQ